MVNYIFVQTDIISYTNKKYGGKKLTEKRKIKISNARPGKFDIAVVSIPIGCGMIKKQIVPSGEIRETKNGMFIVDNNNQVICGGSGVISFNIARVKDEQPGQFKKGIFQIYLKGGKSIIKIIENGVIEATKIGNVVFKNSENKLSVVCGQSARIVYIE